MTILDIGWGDKYDTEKKVMILKNWTEIKAELKELEWGERKWMIEYLEILYWPDYVKDVKRNDFEQVILGISKRIAELIANKYGRKLKRTFFWKIMDWLLWLHYWSRRREMKEIHDIASYEAELYFLNNKDDKRDKVILEVLDWDCNRRLKNISDINKMTIEEKMIFSIELKVWEILFEEYDILTIY